MHGSAASFVALSTAVSTWVASVGLGPWLTSQMLTAYVLSTSLLATEGPGPSHSGPSSLMLLSRGPKVSMQRSQGLLTMWGLRVECVNLQNTIASQLA